MPSCDVTARECIQQLMTDSDYLCVVLIRSNQETVDRLTVNESIHNRGDVRDRDAPIKKVIGFDQNGHAGIALIETARCADARLERCESTGGNLRFQRSINFF